MTEPNEKLLADKRIPRIKLDGKEWPIPPLTIKQIEVVVPLFLEHQAEAAKVGLSAQLVSRMAAIVLLGLERGHEGITRDELDAMASGVMDLSDAVLIVARQAGMVREDPKKTNGVASGEAKGALETTARSSL